VLAAGLAPPSDGKISPCLGKLIKKAAAQRLLFEARGRHVAERGMQPLFVVDLFQELADGRTGVGQIAIFVAQHLLVLKRLHERFAGRVVPRVALARHADLNAVGFEQIRVIIAGVLRAAVGMMHQAGFDGAARKRHA